MPATVGREPRQSCALSATNEYAQQVLVDEPQNLSSLTSSDDSDDDQQEVQPSSSSPSCYPPPEVAFVSLVDGKYKVRGRLLLPAPASTVYSLLTDYGACHRMFSNIASSEVLTTSSGDVQVIQSCKWTFLAFSGTFKVHLGVSEDPSAGILTFQLVHSNFMRDFQGCWTIKSARPPRLAEAEGGGVDAIAGGLDANGNSKYVGEDEVECCEVQHELAVVPAVPVPPPVSYYTRNIFVRQVEGILLDLQRGVMAAVAVRSG